MKKYIKANFFTRKKNVPPSIIFRTKFESDVESFMKLFFGTDKDEYFLTFPDNEEVLDAPIIVPVVMFGGSIISKIGTNEDPI